MEIILNLFVLGLMILVLLILYTLLKWVLRTKARAAVVSLSVFIVVTGFTIYQLFFLKLEFIQSKVYPDLYLVDNIPKDRSILNQDIKDFVLKRIKTQVQKQPIDANLSLRFYAYSKNYNPLVFGDEGTAYFVEHKEDFEGMVVENLDMYFNLKLAVLDKPICNDNTRYCAKLHFFKEGKGVKTDIIDISFDTINHENN